MQITKLPIRNVLLIDDDEDDCIVFRMALAEVSPEVQLQCKTSCENVSKELDTLQPDLLFLDINLPRINGIECLQHLQQHHLQKSVPVVVYSSSELPRNLLASYELGATLYFRKPSNIGELVQALKNILTMNWHAPDSIKHRFYRNGRYHVYQEGNLQ